MQDLTRQLKSKAHELGFPLVGATAACEPSRLLAFHRWLDNGYAGTMTYLDSRRAAYSHPRHVLDGCKTVIMLAMPYGRPDDGELETAADSSSKSVRVARYAQGEIDYHDLIHERLKRLKEWLVDRVPTAQVRGVVDTAPLLEREFAELAGLGWVGKNTLLLNRQWGSYFFLAALLTDLELPVDPATDKGYCGTCSACLDNCPTQAFVEPYVLDANRCISYLTIEHRELPEESLRSEVGDWLFGCDICQMVCPWNRKRQEPEVDLFAISHELDQLSVGELLELDAETFRRRFRNTPLWRSKRRGIVRNAILIAVNRQLAEFLPQVQKLVLDEEPLIRQAATWAVERLGATGNTN